MLEALKSNEWSFVVLMFRVFDWVVHVSISYQYITNTCGLVTGIQWKGDLMSLAKVINGHQNISSIPRKEWPFLAAAM